MANQKNGLKRTRTGKSLNLVLWFSFSVFALVVILVYGVVQNVLIHKQYREMAVKTLSEAGKKMLQVSGSEDTVIARKLYGIANEYGVCLYILDENGESVFPEYTAEGNYSELASVIKGALSDRESTLIEGQKEIAFGAKTSVSGRACYLYLALPDGTLGSNVGNFRWMSMLTGAFSVVLAFVASGFVAMLITKPVTEVTERAKELSRGNYQLNFKKDYYCAEITELSDALDNARVEISKADKMQKELIANVSHDFKTPLTMIKAYASMIREISGEEKEKRDAHAQIIIDESDRLAALVGDLLDLSKLRAGLVSDVKKEFNLSEEVYRIANRFDYLKETGGYQIQTEIEDDLYTVACRERIEQVLYNLIGNAVNYTGADKRVIVKLFRRNDCARFEVYDTGKGIPPDEVDAIWDRYYRSNKTHKRPIQGTGLGLSIVKSILLAHECPFGVLSEVGKGSCFWVEFLISAEETEEDKNPKRKREEV